MVAAFRGSVRANPRTRASIYGTYSPETGFDPTQLLIGAGWTATADVPATLDDMLGVQASQLANPREGSTGTIANTPALMYCSLSWPITDIAAVGCAKGNYLWLFAQKGEDGPTSIAAILPQGRAGP